MENEIKETEQNNIKTSDVANNDEEFEGDISGDALNMTDSHSERSEESESEENPEDEPLDTEDEEPVIEEHPTILEPDGFVYFDENKLAKMQPIKNYICRIPIEQWQEFCTLTIGKDYDIVDGEFVDLRQTEEYIAEKLGIKRAEKLAENTQKAKQAIEEGYVIFKDAQFETNAQTVGDLTDTMLLMQTSETSEYIWLSKNDKTVEFSLQDFITLRNLITEYKNTIWIQKYISFKTAIENAKTIDELELIDIDYFKEEGGE